MSPWSASALTPWRASRWTSRSAPRFVRTKTSVSPVLSPGARRASRTFVLWSTETKRCSISPSARSAGSSASKRDGLEVYARASSPTSPSSVAEKNIVWRFLGTRRTILSTCGLKPMSSMRSASSRTRMRIRSSDDHPALREVLEPARAWRRRRAPRAPCRLAPERDAAVDGRRRGGPSASRPTTSSSVTCCASSRVGTSTSALGRRRAASTRSTIGSANASVLPEPVGDFARTSSPASASGRTSVWMRKGSVDGAGCERVDHRLRHAKPRERLLRQVVLLLRSVRDSPSPNARRRNEKLISRPTGADLLRRTVAAAAERPAVQSRRQRREGDEWPPTATPRSPGTAA